MFGAHPAIVGASSNGIRGIDVSDFQPVVDWAQVKAGGVTFAFVKATEGTGFTAKTFKSKWTAARAAGLLVGAYHFCRPALPLSTADDQAKHFVSTVVRVIFVCLYTPS